MAKFGRSSINLRKASGMSRHWRDPEPPEAEMTINKRFDSWKEISLYLRRSIRTCYKWNKDLGLPVYRINKRSKRSRVIAFKPEIDRWFKRNK